MQNGSNVESDALDDNDALSPQVVEADSATDDFIQFITQPGFPLVDAIQQDNEDHTVVVADRRDVPDPTPTHSVDQIVPTDSALDQTAGPSGEPLRKKTRKTDRSTRFTPAISPETSPDRKTLCPTPPSSPATSLDSVFLYAGSGYSPDHMTSWNTPQRITWTSTKAGQTSYPFNSPPEEDIEVEEVPAVLSEPEPMQMGRSRLSLEEKRRWRNEGLCLYCGAAGHIAAQCPVKARTRQ